MRPLRKSTLEYLSGRVLVGTEAFGGCCRVPNVLLGMLLLSDRRTDPPIRIARNLIATKELKSCAGMRAISQRIDRELQRLLR